MASRIEGVGLAEYLRGSYSNNLPGTNLP